MIAMDSTPPSATPPASSRETAPARSRADGASSPELTGGAGFTFEDVAVAVYLVALLTQETAPGLPGRIVTAVSVQQAAFGEPLDDLIVDGEGQDGSLVRLSLQVKTRLTVSAAASNTDFREVVLHAWQTVRGVRFRPGTDRVGAVVGNMAEGKRRALKTVCEWARPSGTTATAFAARLEEGTGAGDDHRAAAASVSAILRDAGEADPDAAAFEVLRHFVLVDVDTLHEGATTDPQQVAKLRPHLRPDQASRSDALWDALRRVAREAAGRATAFTRAGLLAQLRGAFAFAGSPRFHHALELLREEARLALAGIENTIGGSTLDRSAAVERVRAAVARHRFVQVTGLPGVGKSAVLRALAEEYAAAGPVLVLKADRVEAPTWHAYAGGLGVGPAPIGALLAELAAVAEPVLFIDGLDRFGVEQRGVVTDVLRAALRATSPWRVVATVRDSGTEPLKTWLPDEVWGEGVVGVVHVEPLDEDEAAAVARAQPALRPLLFGGLRVREVARRPFFAAVLARALACGRGGAPVAPGSEVELAQVWWDRGGHDADGARAAKRQQALLALARTGAASLGKPLSASGLDPGAVDDLVQDGLLRKEGRGHRLVFAHDILFEWAFLHLLLDRGDWWMDEVRGVGEPPALGRVVELLSEAVFADDAGWEETLARVEASGMRPQWTRAWLLGPFNSPAFPDRARAYAGAVFRDGGARAVKLVTWFQAEKTRANPLVLDGRSKEADETTRERAHAADLLAWPSDFHAWSRYLGWVLDHAAEVPQAAWPDAIAGFEVWQNCLGDVAHPLTERILTAAQRWLEEIEADRAARYHWRPDAGQRPAADAERHRRVPGALLWGADKDVARSLRLLVLRGVRLNPRRVRDYLSRLRSLGRLEDGAYEQIVTWSPWLAPAAAADLVDLVLERARRPLPAEVAAGLEEDRLRGGTEWRYHSFSVHEWRSLGLDDSPGLCSPASPLREPFRSLFLSAPNEGLRLVRDLANHAIAAWSQLWRFDPGRRGTPLPLVLAFPWGEQTFAGDGGVYAWFRGQGAPALLTCGLMALEEWALGEVERGRDPDAVIADVVQGHISCATLGIAVVVALNMQRISPATLPFATSQRIWRWDLQRCVFDMSGNLNLIGFWRPGDIEHGRAVEAGNRRDVRRRDVRDLAQLFVLAAPTELQQAASRAVQAFPLALPFDLEEEARDPDGTARHGQTAEIWSQLGRVENYSVTPVGDEAAVEIVFDGPARHDPEVVDTVRRSARMLECLRLAAWGAEVTGAKSAIDPLVVPDMLAAARRMDAADLFDGDVQSGEERDARRDAVAAVAAAALNPAVPLGSADLEWAVDVLARAYAVPERVDSMWTPKAPLAHHPGLAAAHGFAALIRRGIEPDGARRGLIMLAAHPLEQVASTALGLAVSLWEEDAPFAWTALGLGIRLSIVDVGELRAHHRDGHADAVTPTVVTAVQGALQRLGGGGPVCPLPALPAAWSVVPFPRATRDGSSPPLVRREPDVCLAWDFLPRLFPYIPVGCVLSDPDRRSEFLDFCDQMLAWTTARLNPPGSGEPHGYGASHRGDVYEWRIALCDLLARVALQTPAEEALERFFVPMAALDDGAAASLLNPFADRLARRGVMDPPVCAPQAIPLLTACADRIVRCEDWTHARDRGGVPPDHELQSLARTLLFVAANGAPRASRFANGEWEDIGLILPVVDRFVGAVGDVAAVAVNLVELCERAGRHYPAEVFASEVLAMLSRHPGTPPGWRRHGVPRRLASLVQAVAERTRPLPPTLKQDLLRILDALVDMGDRRAAALQSSELFRDARVPAGSGS